MPRLPSEDIMDDNRVEETLRESWKPEMPDGMRERVLRAAREELLRVERPRVRYLRWKPLLASVAIVVALSTNIAAGRMESRIAKMTDGYPITAPANGDFLNHRRELATMLALKPSDGRDAKQTIGDETL